jgi:hypothetical protein
MSLADFMRSDVTLSGARGRMRTNGYRRADHAEARPFELEFDNTLPEACNYCCGESLRRTSFRMGRV